MKQQEQNERDTERRRDDLAIGRGPVVELLKSGRPVECVYIQKGLQGSVIKIAAICRDNGIVVKEAAAKKLDDMCGGGNHQGVIAVTGGVRYCELEDLLRGAGEEPPFLVLADGIEDPHNLGAILRTAEAAGAHGAIIPKRRGVGVTFGVLKASAGAAEHIPVARVPNLPAAVETLKKNGLWIFALDLEGEPWTAADFKGPVALVVGSEGRGVSRLMREKCDFSVGLPMRGKIGSLNASVAAGIVMYEVARQRLGIKAL